MFFNKLNLNHLRIFQSVYKTASMTLAARELHLTQSGVSQHINSLEETLKIHLFDRIGQKLVPTAHATLLYQTCSHSFGEIEKILNVIHGGESYVSGRLRIGMPVEFGLNVILPMLAEFGKKFKEINFKLNLGYAQEMNQALLNGELDFAFVDEFRMDPRIEVRKVYEEVVQLCASHDFMKKIKKIQNAKKFYESIEYVSYQENEPVLRLWFQHHLNSHHLRLNPRFTVMDVQGVARLIVEGLGAGILPQHYVDRLKKEGKNIYVFEGSGKALINKISIAHLKQRTHSQAAIEAMKWFDEKLK